MIRADSGSDPARLRARLQKDMTRLSVALLAGVILGAITPAKSPGRKSTFVEAVRESLSDVRDSLDPEDSERNEVMIGRIEELARQTESPLERLERMVHPWTSYLVLPLFALVNAGVALRPEGTIPAARLYVENFQKLPIAKFFYVENMFAFGARARSRGSAGSAALSLSEAAKPKAMSS